MKTVAGLLIAGLLFLLAGCIPSLHPLYTNDDLIFDQALLGTWTGEKKSKWVFRNNADQKSYQAVYADNDGNIGKFEAHLLKIKGTVFLDLYPVDPKLSQNVYYQMHLIPAHSFLRVTQIGPSLKLQPLDTNWLTGYLKKNPDALAYEVIGDNDIVLTASTRQLQKFVLKHLHTKDAFAEATEWKRK